MILRLFRAWRDGRCVSCGCLLVTRILPKEAFRCLECQLQEVWWAKPASKAYKRAFRGGGRLEIISDIAGPRGYRTQFGAVWWR